MSQTVQNTFLPGSTLGILGSGQLGRMLALVAKRMGYCVQVYSPEPESPAGQVADVEIVAEYTDERALRRFADHVDVVTIEFENIPVATLKTLEQWVPVYPQPHVLYVTQNRAREKTFLSDCGLPVTPFVEVYDEDELLAGLQAPGVPAVLKTAGFGYDGKGQAVVSNEEEALAAYRQLNEPLCILEQFIELEKEISVIAARIDGKQYAAYSPVENRHQQQVLDLTVAPAQISQALEDKAMAITRDIMERLNVRGVLCVEFFVTKDGRLLINELAPRPHNSGHLTIEASTCSQFEQQLRAVCGLPLGDPSLRSPAAMVNLLGNLWQPHEPDWPACLQIPGVYLHLYGKSKPRPGRKMGHITALAETPQSARSRALQARQALEKAKI
jgi:5-(carboxyamino)imidazole ribonucleotide synthase